MDKKQKILIGSVCFLSGVVAGFLLAPVKHGVYCGNGNANTFMNKEEAKKFIEELVNKIDKEK